MSLLQGFQPANQESHGNESNEFKVAQEFKGFLWGN